MSARLSRGLSGRGHAVGEDQAPAMQEMAREEGRGQVTVQPLTLELIGGLRQVVKEGFGSKVCCCCISIDGSDLDSLYRKHPERLPMCGIAIGADGTPLGFVQLATYPFNDKDGLHKTKPGAGI